MNQTIERDEVLNPCIKLCKKFEMSGLILEWRRLDVFDKTHVDGSPDLELKIPHEDVVFLFMAECKKADGGVQSKVQIEYEEKYKPYRNVCYQLIRSPEELEYFVKKLSNRHVDMTEFLAFECNPIIEKATDI